MAEHTTTKLPALRNANNFDDWKYQAVATLAYLQLYLPIAEGAPPRLENVRNDTATANLQRTRTALIEKDHIFFTKVPQSPHLSPKQMPLSYVRSLAPSRLSAHHGDFRPS